MRVNTNLAAQSICTQYAGKTGNVLNAAERLTFGSTLKTAADSKAAELLDKMRSRMRGPDGQSVGCEEAAPQDKPP